MGCKVVMIGGGSYAWTPRLATDLFLKEGLRGGSLVLVDTNREAAELLRRYTTLLSEKIGTEWRIAVSDLEPALDGADVVGISISTGDVETMHLDYTIPEAFGVYHTVADTTGPGGISRSLRNIPVFLDIARKMERHCPDAWLVHVTNPLNQLTHAVARETGIKCAGLCHGYAGTVAFLAKFFGVEIDDVDAVSVGVNHGTWLTEIAVKGAPVDRSRMTVRDYLRFEAAREGPIQTGTTDDEIEAMFPEDASLPYLLPFELFEMLGVYPIGQAPHVAENFSFYLNDLDTIRKHRIRRKGVLPMRRESKEQRKRDIIRVLDGRAELEQREASREDFSSVVESLFTGRPSRVMATMANTGQITNLPLGVAVETWATVNGDGITPVNSGEVPASILGILQPVIAEMALTVEAAVTGDRSKAVQAMYISPMVHRKDRAAELVDRLIEATKAYLPQF